MKLFQILSEGAELASKNIRQLADLVQKAIENDHGSSFKAEVNFKNHNSNFGDRDTATFTVDFVNSRDHGEEPAQNTSKKLNALIAPLMKDFRAAGLTFTQPEGVHGASSENDRVTTGKLEFTISAA